MQRQIERLQAQLGDLKENAHLKTAYKNLFDSIQVSRAQTKSLTDSLNEKLNAMIHENAKLRAQLFDKISKQKNIPNGTSVNTKFSKPSVLGKPPSNFRSKLYVVTPLPKSLPKSVTSHSVPKTQESNVVKNCNVIAPGMFRINPSQTSRVDTFMPNKQSKESVRTNRITTSQPHVITKENVNPNSNGLSSTGVESAAKTRRP
ncbi:hypothetical protein Tco_0751977 [Tanacetum coccineum]|uniref:Uncharacterized protein n=1 Tax=Tanacetum coccineum TaxID=301880 RepID=A0ABQ4Z772_9ASTR